MKSSPRRKIYLGIALGVILILGLAAVGILKLQEYRTNRSLSKVAKPVFKMDLLAPQEHGWISNHEIFFLREKNQGDFMCVKVNVHDGKETIIQSLSPYLRDKEDRALAFKVEASPSGAKMGIAFESSGEFQRYLVDLDSGESTALNSDAPFENFWTWLPDESGWIEWIQTERAPLYSKRRPHVRSTSHFAIKDWIHESDFTSFFAPRFSQSDQLLFLTIKADKKDYRANQGTLLLHQVSLNSTNNKKENFTTPILEHTFIMGWASADQTASQWLVALHKSTGIFELEKTKTFPFLKVRKQKQQLRLFDTKSHRWSILDPDIDLKSPQRFKLNPSGTHFSFIYQGQIWVSAIADMLP